MASKLTVLKKTSPSQKTIKYHKGGLHETTHTPMGEPIPASKVEAAAAGKYGSKGKKQVAFMRNVLTGKK
jgi:hypothetical protein